MTTITIPMSMLIEAAAAIKAVAKGSHVPVGYAAWEACLDADFSFGSKVRALVASLHPVEVVPPAAIEALQTAAFSEGFDQAIEQGEALGL